MRKITAYWLIAGTLLPALVHANKEAKEIKVDSYTFGGLEARAIGPAVMSGRIAALDATSGDTPRDLCRYSQWWFVEI